MANKKKGVIVSDVTVSKKKNKAVKKVVKKTATKKTATKKTVTKKVKKSQVVSQSPVSSTKTLKGQLTTTVSKVDTNTPVNRWVAPIDPLLADKLELIDDIQCSNNFEMREHKMFEADRIEQDEANFKPPFWVRILWWFVKK